VRSSYYTDQPIYVYEVIGIVVALNLPSDVTNLEPHNRRILVIGTHLAVHEGEWPYQVLLIFLPCVAGGHIEAEAWAVLISLCEEAVRYLLHLFVA